MICGPEAGKNCESESWDADTPPTPWQSSCTGLVCGGVDDGCECCDKDGPWIGAVPEKRVV